MMGKKLLVLAGALGLVVGFAAWAYAGCGACGAGGHAPAKTTGDVAVTRTTPFQVRDVTGPAKGQELCYICRYGGRPSFVVFTRGLDGHLPETAKAVDRLVQTHKDQRLAGFVVLLGEDTKANRQRLARLARKHDLSIPLTIAADGKQGPKAYRLDGHWDTLVLVTHRNKVHKALTLHCDAKACSSKGCAKTDKIAEAGKELLDSI